MNKVFDQSSDSTRRRVLIVEDDFLLLSMMADGLSNNGYDVLTAVGERELRGLLDTPSHDLVILDLGLDGAAYKGLDLVRDIRSARNVPIIVVSGHAQPWDRLRALEMGIDDYITKPFLLKEVLIRIERVLRLYNAEASQTAANDTVFAFAGLALDPVRRTVRKAEGQLLDLTETEFNILRILVCAAGRIVTRDELSNQLRGYPWRPSDRTIDGHVARLRGKIEWGVDRPQIIKSARGIGYVLAAPISAIPS